jgi:hypothetical protein
MTRSSKIPAVILVLLATITTATVVPSVLTNRRSDSQIGPIGTSDLLHVNGTRIQNASDQNVTLIGVGYGDYTQLFNSGNATADAINIASHGYNAVELVVEWGGLMIGPTNLFNASYEQRIKTWVNALTQQGIYIIIVMHADCDWILLDCNHLRAILGPTQYCLLNPVHYTSSFYTASISNSSSGIAQLTDAWLNISRLFPDNGNVIGYDILNEPFYNPAQSSSCGILSNSAIRIDWHKGADELVSVLRRNGDNRIIFLQEAPENSYFGANGNVTYTNTDINFTNYVAIAHFYEGENSGSPWQACTGNYTDIYGLWDTTNYPGPCEHTTAIWAHAAQTKFPDQAFFVSEYGGIWGNSPGDTDQSWIFNATRAFYTTGVAGWTYWSDDTTGTWDNDIRPAITMQPSSITVVQGASASGSFPIIDTQSFIGTLTYSYSSSVPGLTATFSPATASLNIGGSSNLQYTVAADASVGTGTYIIYWKTDFGSLTFTAMMTVTVTTVIPAAGGGGGHLLED